MSAFIEKLSEYGLYADSMDTKKEIQEVEKNIMDRGVSGERILRKFLSEQGSIRVKDTKKMKEKMKLATEYQALPDMLLRYLCLEWDSEEGFEFQTFIHPIQLYAEFQQGIIKYEAEYEKKNEKYRLAKIFNPGEALKKLEKETFELFEEFMNPESNVSLLKKLEEEFSDALWKDKVSLGEKVQK